MTLKNHFGATFNSGSEAEESRGGSTGKKDAEETKSSVVVGRLGRPQESNGGVTGSFQALMNPRSKLEVEDAAVGFLPPPPSCRILAKRDAIFDFSVSTGGSCGAEGATEVATNGTFWKLSKCG